MDIKPRNKSITQVCPIYLMASLGTLSTLVAETITYPLEYAKTKLQMNGTQNCPKYKNLRTIFSNTQSISKYYIGYNANLVKIIPYASTKIMYYEIIRTAFTGDIVETSYLRKLSTISLACSLSLFASNIGDILRIRIINNNSVNNNVKLYNVIQESIHYTGLKGFLRGYWINCIQQMLISALEIGIYDRIKIFFYKNFQLDGIQTNIIASFITGTVSSLLFSPIDSFKTRYMNQLQEQQNYWKCLLSVIKDEGLLALYRGTLPYGLKFVSCSILTLQFYESFKHYITQNK